MLEDEAVAEGCKLARLQVSLDLSLSLLALLYKKVDRRAPYHVWLSH